MLLSFKNINTGNLIFNLRLNKKNIIVNNIKTPLTLLYMNAIIIMQMTKSTNVVDFYFI